MGHGRSNTSSEHVKQRVAEVIAAGGKPYVLDYRVHLPSTTKSVGCAHAWIAGQERASVACTRFYGALVDITTIKALEFEVQQAREERLRDAALATRFFTWELDLESNVFTVDKLAAARKIAANGAAIASNDTYTNTVEDALKPLLIARTDTYWSI